MKLDKLGVGIIGASFFSCSSTSITTPYSPLF